MEKAIFIEKVKTALAAGVIEADGHTLYDPGHYAPHFTLEELTEAGVVQTHKSDGTLKGTMYGPNGIVIDKLEAVYNLDFLYWVNRKLETGEYPRAMGRGSQAQEIVSFIRNALAE
jgi:hypothetical protein